MRFINDQRGSTDPLIIPLAISIVILVMVSGFGIWTYTKYLDASKVEQAEIDQAVQEANAKLTEDLEVAFAEREKSPTKVYKSPQYTGSVEITYPKTWSVYTEEDERGGAVNAYLNPKEVRNIGSDAPVALRLTVKKEKYSAVAEDYAKQADAGVAKITAIEVAGTTGIRVDGQITDDFQGAVVMLPLREKTLKIWTENTSYLNDFNDIVIKNLTFVP